MSEEHNHSACEKHCHCIRINDLGVKFGKDVILEDVNLHMHCGELTVVIGPNGAGKSTLLRAILGEIEHEGTIDLKETSTGNQSEMRIAMSAFLMKA